MKKPFILLLLLAGALALPAQKKQPDKKAAAPAAPATAEKEKDPFNSATFSGLKFRSIGPALTSGRVGDLAVNPKNRHEYYVAVASGGVWKTLNNGNSFEPVFDAQGSYSIGCVTLDPKNSNVVWVGTGENNAQRSVAYGDGVYKSEDGGKSWKNMGLKNSEHIGMIAIDPRNSQTVFVAAQGPVWSAGGERGLYKSIDGGKNWRNVLNVSEHTGVSEVFIHPADPNLMYAVAWQRRRHVWTFIGGGPESALYRSTDGGETWEKAGSGLPAGVELGRIGLAISPANPDVMYAIVEAQDGKGGVFRSADRGYSWSKQNSYTTSGNYYQEVFCDPADENRVYFMDVWVMVSNDGGKTISRLGNERWKHVDNHAMWIDPANPGYYLVGCDGGLYESYDAGANWVYKANLPITQFYKVSTDNDKPFYNVYGGTQDNNSLGGPSRTLNNHGISNADWFITNGGDGFETVIDPLDPNIVYSQSQYGVLVRYDKRNGERTLIQPAEGKDEAAYRWNWDAPLLISPHKNTRLYFAANKLFRSDNRGDSWIAVSDDLSRQIDRNQLPVMDKVWGMDAVNKNVSTSIYGNIVALDESPLQEGLLYVGTDDGLVQVSENGGGNWRRESNFAGVPETTYVNFLLASRHDANVVYAVFNNHKRGDFKPYIMRSNDKGRSWTAIAANLPERGSVYCIVEDHVDRNLLFAGTEFGVFFTADGGGKWTQLKAGLPTIAVRDMDIQRRENDLVLATFGRGFYILEDYTPLRFLNKESLEKAADIYAVKDGLMFVQAQPLGYRGKGFQGEAYFTTPNPPVGAVISYYLKEAPKTLKQQRQEKEKELVKAGKPVPYPSFEEMRAEDEEEAPYLLFTITDADGQVVNRIRQNAAAGINRVVWDFSYPATTPVSLRSGGDENNPFSFTPRGHMAEPGIYSVSMHQVAGGVSTLMAGPVKFTIRQLDNRSIPVNTPETVAFAAEVGELLRQLSAVNATHGDLLNKVKHMKAAVMQAPAAPVSLLTDLSKLEGRLNAVNRSLNGDASLSKREFPDPPALNGRLGAVNWGLSGNMGNPTQTARQQYTIVKEGVQPVLTELRSIGEVVAEMEKMMEKYKAPYTPGRGIGQLKERE